MGFIVPAQPVLETQRLRLRPLTLDDMAWYFMHFSHPEVIHGHGMPPPRDLGTAEVEIRALTEHGDPMGSLRWGIVDRATGELLGTVGLHRRVEIPRRTADIGYDLEPSAWGHGYMAEAIGAILRYAFGPLRIERVSATVLVDNPRSLRVLERAGFTVEGLRRGTEPDENGAYRDEWRLHLDRPADVA